MRQRSPSQSHVQALLQACHFRSFDSTNCPVGLCLLQYRFLATRPFSTWVFRLLFRRDLSRRLLHLFLTVSVSSSSTSKEAHPFSSTCLAECNWDTLLSVSTNQLRPSWIICMTVQTFWGRILKLNPLTGWLAPNWPCLHLSVHSESHKLCRNWRLTRRTLPAATESRRY